MLDGDATTFDWQEHPTRLAILPTGSFEQHSAHLPLATDTISAEYMARGLAEELDAALLPALPYGTALEHAGFRGTVSLRPETLMTVLRDIVDELEQQGFRTLIVLNGHGGNWALAPAVRDINRADRAIKVLLIDGWEAWNVPGCTHIPGDIHAGAAETSWMLAIRPDLVRPALADRPTDPLLRQSDLNTFGAGCFAPHGAVGYPSKASIEDGRRYVAGIRSVLVPYVRARLARLEENRRYAGAGGIALRRMTAADLADGMRLKSQASWNQLADDWRTFFEERPEGCIAAVHNGEVVGSATAIGYGADVAWIGMVLVDPAFRRLGIASRLMEAAVESARGFRVAKLDATPDGKLVYDRLGFVDEYRLTRWTHACLPPFEPDGAAPLTVADLPRLAETDRRAFAADRLGLLRRLLARSPQAAWKIERGGAIVAYAFGRPGANFHQLGPIVANDGAAAIVLARAALAAWSGRPVVLDVPDAQTAFTGWLADLGFARQRPFIRMYRGPDAAAGEPARVFAIVGPEFG